MTIELDHVMVCPGSRPGSEQPLVQFGLNFTQQRVHSGQGTANICALFDNAYLEILWRNNDTELQSRTVKPLSLWERVRWRETVACPFGIAFRLMAPTEAELPFDTWPYAAPFLPSGMVIPIVTPKYSPEEPLVFISPMARAPSTVPELSTASLEHRGERRILTKVRVLRPQANPLSPGLSWFRENQLLGLEDEPEYHLELEWNGGKAGQTCDFRPDLPMSIQW